jgi:hypothetical protein
MLDRLADAIEEHFDTERLLELIEAGCPPGCRSSPLASPDGGNVSTILLTGKRRTFMSRVGLPGVAQEADTGSDGSHCHNTTLGSSACPRS